MAKAQSLVVVPCWWDGTLERYRQKKERKREAILKERKARTRKIEKRRELTREKQELIKIISLAATICFERPDLTDLIKDLKRDLTTVPISLNPEFNYFSCISFPIIFSLFYMSIAP
jgi:hypothetical protein